jgi:phosphatidylserine decarboxylase
MQLLFIIAQYLLPQHLLSRLVGRLADSEVPWIRNTFIDWFRRRYNVDMNEAAEPDPHAYRSFNAFFTRALREGARPLDADPASVLCPADGSISQIGSLDDDWVLQAKQQTYSARILLGGDAELARRFAGGSFATIYLSPRDYHRVHMPLAGTLVRTVYVPGKLFSVNQATAENVAGLFARNERLVCIFETELGPMAVVLVGAMIVAGIETVWGGQVAPPPALPTTLHYDQPPQTVRLERGAELGRFKLGSTAIVLLPKGAAAWRADLQAGSAVRMGEALGHRREAGSGQSKP